MSGFYQFPTGRALLARRLSCLLAGLWLALLSAIPLAGQAANCPGGTRLYVNKNNQTPGDGTSWATAYTTLGGALETSRICTNITEIWVAKGTYLPTYDHLSNSSPTDPRTKTFYLKSGLSLYGGFAGTETALSQRVKTSANITTLSGDLGTAGVATDNAYHVVLGVSITAASATTLDGFTISGGYANGTSFTIGGLTVPGTSGGGMLAVSASPLITNCTFSGNYASAGGGLSANTSSTPTITNCFFSGNTAAINGGGMNNNSSSNPTLTNCVFSSNVASNGGAISTPFSLTLVNCTIVSNTANSNITGCGGVYMPITSSTSNVSISNCILFYNNGSGSGAQKNLYKFSSTGTATMSYCAVESYPGSATSNNTGVPYDYDSFPYGAVSNVGLYFENTADPDGADNVFGTADDGLMASGDYLVDGSNPNTTTPTTDCTGYTRVSTFDQGAYEYRSVAVPTLTSISPSAELPGQTVTLTGTNFTAASTVKFGTVAATSVTYVSSTSLMVTVPVGATAGSSTVVVTTSGSSNTTSPAFTVLGVYQTGTANSCVSAAASTASIADGEWHYLLSTAGDVILAYKYTGANLGTFSASLWRGDGSQSVRNDGRGRSYLDRNVHITASGGGFPGRSVSLRLYGLPSEYARLVATGNLSGYGTLNVMQYQGSNEDCDLSNDDFVAGEFRTLGTTSGLDASGNFFVSELTVSDHFSEFYLTGSQALPVELSQFTAQRAGAGVQLEWRTASEKNNNHFDIERSLDGKEFTRLGQVKSQGVTSTYSYRDEQLPSASVVYYRLRQVDQDGSISYSPIRTVQLTSSPAHQLTISPNPGRQTTLTGTQAGAAVQVLDALGRVVLTATADASGAARLALPASLPAGVYAVRSGRRVSRLVVE